MLALRLLSINLVALLLLPAAVAYAATGTIQFSSATGTSFESSTRVGIAVNRTGGSEGAVGVTVTSVSGGTATGGASCSAGVDYINLSTTVGWADAESGSKSVIVSVCPDSNTEGDETVNLALSSPTGGAGLGSQTTMVHTIQDDSAGGTIDFYAATLSSSESSSSATIYATRSGGNQGAVGVTATSVSGGTATGGASCTAGVDYINFSTTITWADGATGLGYRNLTVCPDVAVEPDETVNLDLSDATGGASLGALTTMVYTIRNDDAAGNGTIQFGTATGTDSESATSVGISLTRSGGSAGSVSVTVASASDTATGGASCTAGVDYIDLNTTLAWANGETGSKSIFLTVCIDPTVEPDETANLTLSSPVGGATLGSPSTRVQTIENDDAPGAGAIQFSSATGATSESVAAASISASRTGGSQGAVSVTVVTASGGTATGGASCTAGVDFIDLSATLAWADGETGLKSATLSVCPDPAVEPDETVNLALNSPTGGATLGSPSTRVHTILNDDVNDAPIVANPIPDQAATEDVAFSFSFAANTFSDEEGDALTYAATLAGGAALPAWLTFDSATRTFSGTPAGSDAGSLSVVVTASDPSSASASDTFTITVAAVNDAPVLDVDGSPTLPSIAEDTTNPGGTTVAALIASGNDAVLAPDYITDVDAGAVEGIAIQAVDNTNGTWQYSTDSGSSWAAIVATAPSPNLLLASSSANQIRFVPNGDFNGSATIDLRAWDQTTGTSGTNIEICCVGGTTAFSAWIDTATITVTAVNDAPIVANTIADQAAAEDAAFSFTFAANTFSDADGDTLTYGATLGNGSPLPAWLTFDSATRTFSGTPAGSDAGSLDVKVTASDSSTSVSDTFTITVSAVNDAPTVANTIADQAAAEDAAFSFTFAANTFSDADGDTLTYGATLGNGSPLPAWLTFNPATRTFSGTPTGSDVGSLDVKVTASDSSTSVSDTFTITVSPGAGLAVVIDIVPGSADNRIKLRGSSTGQVAILSSATFNAVTQVDRSSIRFGRTGTEDSVMSSRRGVLQCSAQDVNADGRADLV